MSFICASTTQDLIEFADAAQKDLKAKDEMINTLVAEKAVINMKVKMCFVELLMANKNRLPVLTISRLIEGVASGHLVFSSNMKSSFSHYVAYYMDYRNFPTVGPMPKGLEGLPSVADLKVRRDMVQEWLFGGNKA